MSTYHNNLWELGYQHLLEFYSVFGHSKVPLKYISPDMFKLGIWVSSQRENYKAKRLSQERYDRLQKLSFVFSVASGKNTPGDESFNWVKGYNHLSDYVSKYGDALVPQDYVCPDGYNLGTWVLRQRQDYKNKKASQERINKLKKLGFIFGILAGHGIPDNEVVNWASGYNHLSDYVKEYGTALVPLKYVCSDGYNLGAWVARQRRENTIKKLSQTRYEKLKKLGFIFEKIKAGHNSSNGMSYCWSEGYRHLSDYVKEYGNALVLRNYVCTDGYKLGSWVHHQRSLYRNNTLHNEQYNKLIELGFVFQRNSGRKNKDKEAFNWENGYHHLCDYKEINGNSLVPDRYICPDGYPLGKWVNNQRNLYKTKRLSLNRVNMLQNIGFVFYHKAGSVYNDEESFQWENGYDHLVEYYSTFGDTYVPGKYCSSDGFSLGTWVETQRESFKLDRLSKERNLLLDKLHFSFLYNTGRRYNTEETTIWNNGYSHLLQYVKTYGNALVSQYYVCEDGFNLGHWVSTRRNDYKRGRLNKNQIKMLKEIGFVFYVNQGIKHDYEESYRWTQGYTHLLDYVEQFGNAFVPDKYHCSDGFYLGSWVATKRQNYNSLSLWQIQKLERIGFCFSIYPRNK